MGITVIRHSTKGSLALALDCVSAAEPPNLYSRNSLTLWALARINPPKSPRRGLTLWRLDNHRLNMLSSRVNLEEGFLKFVEHLKEWAKII